MTQKLPPIELASESDIPGLLELMHLCMPHITRTREELLWQYFRTPSGNSKLYILREEGQIVALYSTFATRFRIAKRTVPARMQLDVMTHPDFRGRGYHSYLIGNCLREARDAGEISYGLPNEQAEGGFRRTPGFIEVGRVPLRTKSLGPQGAPVSENQPLEVREQLNGFGESATRIWNSTPFVTGVHRDQAYLNWRYSRPGQKYSLFSLAGDRGVLVLKVYQSATEKLLHICDLFLEPEIEHLLPHILEFCETFARKENATTITAWLFDGHPYSAAFDRFELKIKDVNRFLFFTTQSPQEEALLAKKDAWHFTQGDSDIF